MPLPVTSLYAALLALVFIVLTGLVGFARSKTTIALGDGGDPGLVVANRRQMNFVENVPLALVLMAMIELNGGSTTWLHVLGVFLLVARVVHPFGLNVITAKSLARAIGAFGTLLVLLAAAGTLLWQVLR